MITALMRASVAATTLLSVGLISFSFVPTTTLGNPQEPGPHVPGEILVKFRAGTPANAVDDALRVLVGCRRRNRLGAEIALGVNHGGNPTPHKGH